MTAGPAAAQLRTAVTGLLGFAAAQEQDLLATRRAPEAGTAACWAAAPLIAHNTEFKRQQLHRLESVRSGTAPAEFGETDHSSEQVYRGYAGRPADAVAQDSWRATGALIASLAGAADDDLLDPSRHPWLRGRMLWLQVIVRGFWHPTGHLGEYYLAHGEPGLAVKLAAAAVAAAADLDAPAPARGMACYNLACVQARSGRPDAAVAALTEAVTLNPDLRANAGRDPDLAVLRDRGQLTAVLAR